MDIVLFGLMFIFSLLIDEHSSQTNTITCTKTEGNGGVKTGTVVVYCSSGYSLISSNTMLSCEKDKNNWFLSPSPSCVYIETSTYPPEISSSIQTTMLQDTTAMTTKSSDIASSTVSIIQSQTYATESHPTLIFTSEFGPTSESFITDTLTSTTHQTDLVMTPSVSLSEIIVPTATSSLRPVSATTTPVMTDLKDKTSDARTVYIAVPIGFCAIAVISVILVLIWRYRRKLSQPNGLKRDRIHGSSFTNRTYAVDALERQSSLINGRPSGDSEYAEISPKAEHCEEASDNVYNTIDNVQENKPESNNTYGHIKQHGREVTDSNYSHIKLNSTTEETGTDNTYAHTTVAKVPRQTQKSPDDVDDIDVTYNRLDIRSLNTTSTNKRKTTEEAEKETEVEYNHTNTGGQESVKDTYSHLNNDLAASPKHSQTGTIHVNVKEMSTSNHDLAKETKQRQYDYAAVSPKRENTVQSQAKLNQQRPVDNHCLQNSYCQAYAFAKEPDITPYEFAKDFDKFSTDDTVKHYPIQIEMQTSKVQMKKCAEADGYETAVVTPHDYLILEPEERTFGKETSFRVVEEELPETRHTDDNEEPEKHQYFTLERMDIN